LSGLVQNIHQVTHRSWQMEAKTCSLDMREPMRFNLVCYTARLSFSKNQWGWFS